VLAPCRSLVFDTLGILKREPYDAAALLNPERPEVFSGANTKIFVQLNEAFAGFGLAKALVKALHCSNVLYNGLAWRTLAEVLKESRL
jgi:hypothetical protein